MMVLRKSALRREFADKKFVHAMVLGSLVRSQTIGGQKYLDFDRIRFSGLELRISDWAKISLQYLHK